MNWMHISEKRIRGMIAAAASCLLLGGCGYEMPDITEDKTELVADYSAALLLKYDSASPSRLLPADSVVHIDFVDPANGIPTEIVPESDESTDIEVNSTPEFSSEDTTVTDAQTGASTGGATGFDSFVGDIGVDVSYSGNYEITDTYPSGEDSNPYLSVAASAGNELLVLHFNLTNTSGADNNVNLGLLGLRYRVSINGGSNKYVMTTLLENDLMSYIGTLAAGEQADVVAVCEISESEASSISTIDFTIRNSTDSAVISLQ